MTRPSHLDIIRYEAVDLRTKGAWEKKVEISKVHHSKKAAKGSWWTTDRWGWIAWENNDGKWRVLVSADGFFCEELDEIPKQYNEFFEDMVYMFGRKNCIQAE